MFPGSESLLSPVFVTRVWLSLPISYHCQQHVNIPEVIEILYVEHYGMATTVSEI